MTRLVIAQVMTPVLLCLTLLLGAPAAEANNGFSGRPGWNVLLNDATTDTVIDQLRQDFRRCQAVPKIYRYDCYRRSYRTGARSLLGSRDYAPVVEALTLVEKRIEAAVEANLDPGQPKLRENPFVQHRAVKPEAVPVIKQATLAAMEEAATLLLRSPGQAGNPHFQRIAAVIDSNKLLLRSALLYLPGPVLRLALGFTPMAALHMG